MDASQTRPILIAGPTASGKSALAIALAQRLGGMLINADSMQVYRELRILTARPSPEEEGLVAHALYGHIGGAEAYSVARWLEDVEAALVTARREQLRPIIVGGTGLYLKALTEGLSRVPAIPADIRLEWRERARRISAETLHAELGRLDPAMADRLHPADTQRVTRALEVVTATGRSLAQWQQQAGQPVIPLASVTGLVMSLPRADLNTRAERRFDLMLHQGAVEEVRGLLRIGLPVDQPVMRAIGVRPLARMLAGEVTAEEGIAQAKAETRQFIKRQQIWLNKHMIAWWWVIKSTNYELVAEFIRNVDDS